MKKLLHKLGIHNWIFIKRMGVYQYEECSICGKRDYFNYWGPGYSALDLDWLNSGNRTILNKVN